jgi:hypothetical protein
MGKKPRLGRPSLPAGKLRSQRIAVFLRPAEHQKLREIAEVQGVEVGQAAREILERALSRRGEKR